MLTIFVDERKLCDAHDVANIENWIRREESIAKKFWWQTKQVSLLTLVENY